jgi:hypothetical protein
MNATLRPCRLSTTSDPPATRSAEPASPPPPDTCPAPATPVPRRNDRVAQRTFSLRLHRFPIRCECDRANCTSTFVVSLEEYAEARRTGRPLTAHSDTRTHEDPPSS